VRGHGVSRIQALRLFLAISELQLEFSGWWNCWTLAGFDSFWRLDSMMDSRNRPNILRISLSCVTNALSNALSVAGVTSSSRPIKIGPQPNGV
jgi:hypothetical protein